MIKTENSFRKIAMEISRTLAESYLHSKENCSLSLDTLTNIFFNRIIKKVRFSKALNDF